MARFTRLVAAAIFCIFEMLIGGVQAADNNSLTPQPPDEHARTIRILGGPDQQANSLYVGFAYDPGQGKYDGVVGSPNDVWNFVDIGTTAVDYLRHPDASGSTARLRITRHDGEWAVNTKNQIYRGYIYHNCQCVDLEATLLDVKSGRYKVYVYAHGDAPNQNANIEVVVGDRTIGKKATSKADNSDFQSPELKKGVHYVAFQFDVRIGENIRIISRRDGSNYSMLNAIQLVPVPKPSKQNSENGDQQSSTAAIELVLRRYFQALANRNLAAVRESLGSRVMITEAGEDSSKSSVLSTSKDQHLLPPEGNDDWQHVNLGSLEIRISKTHPSVASAQFTIECPLHSDVVAQRVAALRDTGLNLDVSDRKRIRSEIRAKAKRSEMFATLALEQGAWRITSLTLPR